MLNIGRLSSGAGEYYVGEVASSAEDYYTGRGEAQGRWVGSLRGVLGLDGAVDSEHFRRVLAGLHPRTGEVLVSSQGSSGRAAARRGAKGGGPLGDEVDSARAAAFLGVSHQHVRRLLKAGSVYREALEEAGPKDVVAEPRRYLVGELVSVPGAGGVGAWRIPRGEVERLAGERTPPKPRPGYDVTLRPPKSVSVLWALSGAEVRAAIRQAHTESVDEVVRYLEQRAVRGRISENHRQVEVETDGVIAAAFDHRTSRAGDPLLHTHVVVANMTRVDGPEGKVWRAIAAHGLFEHAKAAGHLYQAHLRHLLTERLGVAWRPVMNGYADIAGVPAEVVEVFSKRRSEITEVLAESGNTSARAAQVATLETRKPKDYGVDADTLFDQWRDEAAAVGFTADAAGACLHRTHTQALDDRDVAAVFDDLAGPTGLTERASTFRRSDVIEALTTELGSSCTAGEVERLADRFLTSDACVVVDHAPPETAPDLGAAAPVTAPRRGKASTQTRYTSDELARIETRLLEWTRDDRVPRTPPLETSVVEGTVVARPELSAEQVAMVRAVCTHDAAVVPVAGRPGAGKTYAAEAVVAAHVTAGVPIVGCAVSAAAAAELERAAGFARSTAPATTVAKLLMDLDRWGGLAPGSVVVVDEASMLATRDLYRLVAHARRAAGSIVLVGDPDQHGPVEVGGVFQRLCRDWGDDLIRLVENNRQDQHIDRLAIDEYHDGHVADALARLDNAGRVVRSATAGESFDAMVADWYAEHLEGRADPMIAGPNSTRRALNDRARAMLKRNGELTGDAVTVAGHEYQVGDIVVARRNDRRLRATPAADFVKNGSAGVVAAVHADQREVTVDFEREGSIRVPHTYLASGHLEHGYARTSYGVQGATHGVGRYHPTDLSGFEEGYVAMTRGRRSNHLYIVDGTITSSDDEAHQRDERRFDLDDITEALSRRRAGTMAADAAERLPVVHNLATRHTLAELQAARPRLEAILATAPPDPSRALQRAASQLEELRARRNLWTAAGRPAKDLDHLDRAVTRVQRRIKAAERQRLERRRWLETNGELVERHDLVVRAERHRRARISGNPQAFLPEAVVAEAGPEPVAQGERRVWTARLVERAVHWDLSAAGPVVRGQESAVPEPG